MSKPKNMTPEQEIEYRLRRKEIQRRHYEKNKDACLERTREWQAKQVDTPEKRESFNASKRAYNKANPEVRRRKLRRYREKHPERLAESYRDYWKRNKDRINARRKARYPKIRDQVKAAWERNKKAIMKRHAAYIARRLKTDPLFAFRKTLRSRTNFAFRAQNIPKSSKTEAMLGCSWAGLQTHIESLFLPGMTWGNRGKYGWHVDHVVPLSSAKNAEELVALCHYTNLQPLWAEDNLAKSNKLAA